MALVLASSACGDPGPDVPLSDTTGSPEALVEAVLAAVEADDGERLRSLIISRDEFESFLWPAMPDRDHTRLDFFWGTMEANSRKGLRQLENAYGGIPMEVVSIEMPPHDEAESYEDFAYHVGVRVTVRRLDTGEEGLLPSFDGFVEYQGRWKLLNYDEL